MNKILVVEDELSLLKLYERILTDAGFGVDTANDGAEGWRKASRGGYDLIMLDIRMPKADGLFLLKHLENNPPKSPNKKIIVLTVFDNDTYIKEALKHGAHDYLVKSELTPDQIVASVKNLLDEK